MTPPVDARPSPKRARLVAIAICVALIGTCSMALREMMTTRIRTYKPAEVVQRGAREELRMRGSRLEIPGATLIAEWYTYDNEVINQPPYKLSIDLKAADDEVDRIEIEAIQLRSSRGRTYAFSDTIAWPLVLRPDDRGRFAGKLV